MATSTSGRRRAETVMPKGDISHSAGSPATMPAASHSPAHAGNPCTVVLAASEVVGFAKTGGLADVVGSLPRALARRGHRCAVILPLYRCVRTGKAPLEDLGLTFTVRIGERPVTGRLWRSHLGADPKAADAVPVYLIEQTDYFERDDPAMGRGLYSLTVADGSLRDWPDNCERFIFFSRAVLEALRLLELWPDVLHVNDWQTGLIPVYLREEYARGGKESLRAKYARVRTLFTVHNLAYQGVFWHYDWHLTGLPWELFNYKQLEYHGRLNFLKAGIVFADAVSTVSPTYAREIQTPYLGCGLQGALAERSHRLFGIVNGVDYAVWCPATDPYLAANYDPDSVREGKARCKADLQRVTGLSVRPEVPLLGVVARLAEQKGIDLIVKAAPALLADDVQLVILGQGDPQYQAALASLRDRHRDRVALALGFSESLAHQIEAGADVFLMPSQYEPSGLNQLYSLRYGAVPVVRATGGLADTVVDCNPQTWADGTATGFTFVAYTVDTLIETVRRALRMFREQPDDWLTLMRRGMRQDWSWDRSAAEYERLYHLVSGWLYHSPLTTHHSPLTTHHEELMAELFVAFFWHQHQPYYPDDVAGENPMPWVRLHGVKDYYGMALHLLEFPEMACAINLVPSLLVQLEAYTERGASDKFLDVSRRPADGLSEDDAIFLLEHFFMANPDQMIRPWPRFWELYQRRGLGRNTAREALRRFQGRDLRDLQMWFNLAWLHPLAFDRDDGLRSLRDKARHYTEADKTYLLDKHLEILRQVVPLHRQLAERGQVELTTTPFYHPILPLLLDKKLARQALPDVKLPRYTGGYPEDAALHVRRAVEQHTRVFGSPPRGMWPAEGSVCQQMLPLLAEHGIRWIATDEEVLGASTHGEVSRDAHGHVRNPHRLYRPYRVAEGGRELGIVFRDHALSDLIGFHYQRTEPAAAADDFVGKLRSIRQAVPANEQCLVSVILDGENCWEHYPGGGVTFLRALYERCTRSPDIRPVAVGKHLEQHPPRDQLASLFAGSWIHHNFAIWIGHEEDNTAWDALHRTREHLVKKGAEVRDPSLVERAWRELYIAEGSDWFWWYGDDHSSSQDALFDQLFRKHLQNVYLLLGEVPPPDLSRPISRRAQRMLYTLPRAFLRVKIDGRRTFFEWLAAGRYTLQSDRGTMALASQGLVTDLYFGFDVRHLFVRIDFAGNARARMAGCDALRIGFVEPAGWEAVLCHPSSDRPRLDLLYQGEVRQGVEGTPKDGATVAAEDPATGLALGTGQIAEVAIPFAAMGVEAAQPIHFYVELMQGRQSLDRAPRQGTINLLCPSPDFEQIMWDV